MEGTWGDVGGLAPVRAPDPPSRRLRIRERACAQRMVGAAFVHQAVVRILLEDPAGAD